MDPLREMANLAWSNGLQARRERLRDALRRNNLLKPLDLIIEQLERYPGEPIMRLRAASAAEIYDYLERVTQAQYWSSARKQAAIQRYVGLFFDGVLEAEHRNDINRLLARKRLLRSAYLMFIREAVPERVAQATETTPDVSLDEIAEPDTE